MRKCRARSWPLRVRVFSKFELEDKPSFTSQNAIRFPMSPYLERASRSSRGDRLGEHQHEEFPSGHIKSILLALITLTVGWAVCAFFILNAWQHRQSEERAALRREASAVGAKITARFSDYTHALDAAVSYLGAFPSVTRTQWHAFAMALNLTERYPGFKGIGVAFPVTDSEAVSFMRSIQNDGSPEAILHAFPGCQLSGPEHAIVTYIEPSEINRPSIGLDDFSEPSRRKAAMDSRDQGIPVLTDKLVLIQDRDRNVDTSQLLFAPVYRGGVIPTTRDGRRHAFIAWVFTPFILRELLPPELQAKVHTLDLWAFDGALPKLGSLLFSSSSAPPPDRYEFTTQIEVGGRVITLGWSRGADFAPAPLTPQLTVAGIGALASLLLALIVFHLGSHREALEREVARRTFELQRSEQRYRTYIDNASEGLVVHDGAGGILETNRMACSMLGYSREEMLKLNVFDIEVGIDRDFALGEWRKLEPGRSLRVQGRTRKKDGSAFPAAIHVCCFDLDGAKCFLAMVRDLTEQERSKSALLESESLLRQAQKMEAVGRIAGGVAHDFNNILTAFMLHLGTLRNKSDLGQESRATVEELENEASRAAALTRQLLIFSRRQPVKMTPIDLNASISSLLKMLRRLLGEHIAVEIELMEGLPHIRADASMIDQIIMNLCVNARDAMPDGGNLRLVTDITAYNGTPGPTNPMARKGLFATLSVTDNGCGIDNETRSHLFEPFFTTKEQGKGTGLWLATVDGIVKQHGGWIVVESTIQVGSTFRVFLPALTDDQAEDCKAGVAELPKGQGEAILVVEDEESVRLVVMQALKSFGYAPVSARNGPDALRLWEIHGGNLKLVITDLVMPGGMDGAFLIKSLREKAPDLKCMIVTGYAPDATISRLSVPVLMKPFDVPSLLKIVRELMA